MATKPTVLDHSFKFTSRKLTKEGEILSTTVAAALTFLADMTPEEIICRYALREMALSKNAARVKTGAPASRLYVNGNLPPEVASMLATVKAAVAAAVPSMAPKAPAAPKAAPVAPLDLSDDLPGAVAAVMAEVPATPTKLARECVALGERMKAVGLDPTYVEPKAPKAKKAPQAPKAAPVKRAKDAPKSAVLTPAQHQESKAPKAKKAPQAPKAKPIDLAAHNPATAALIMAAQALAAPVEPPKDDLMAALRAKHATKQAEKLAAKKATNDAREAGKV